MQCLVKESWVDKFFCESSDAPIWVQAMQVSKQVFNKIRSYFDNFKSLPYGHISTLVEKTRICPKTVYVANSQTLKLLSQHLTNFLTSLEKVLFQS